MFIHGFGWLHAISEHHFRWSVNRTAKFQFSCNRLLICKFETTFLIKVKVISYNCTSVSPEMHQVPSGGEPLV